MTTNISLVYDASTRTVRTSDGNKAKSIKVYGISGQEVKSASNINSMLMTDLEKGLYIIKSTDWNGAEYSAKVTLN